MRSKVSCPVWREGPRNRQQQCRTALCPYSTASTVLRGRGSGNAAPLPDQKYERGTNRIAVSTLVRAADALDTPLSFFLDGFGPEVPALARKALQEYRVRPADILTRIEDKKVRTAVRVRLRMAICGRYA